MFNPLSLIFPPNGEDDRESPSTAAPATESSTDHHGVDNIPGAFKFTPIKVMKQQAKELGVSGGVFRESAVSNLSGSSYSSAQGNVLKDRQNEENKATTISPSSKPKAVSSANALKNAILEKSNNSSGKRKRVKTTGGDQNEPEAEQQNEEEGGEEEEEFLSWEEPVVAAEEEQVEASQQEDSRPRDTPNHNNSTNNNTFDESFSSAQEDILSPRQLFQVAASRESTKASASASIPPADDYESNLKLLLEITGATREQALDHLFFNNGDMAHTFETLTDPGKHSTLWKHWEDDLLMSSGDEDDILVLLKKKGGSFWPLLERIRFLYHFKKHN